MSRLAVHAFLWAFIVILNLIITTQGLVINKSELNNNNNNKNVQEYVPNVPDINFDRYPMIVPKRAAMLLDRIMVALHHALEDDEKGTKKINDVYKDGRYFNGKKDLYKADKNYDRLIPNDYDQDLQQKSSHFDTRELSDDQPRTDDTMGLQRRGPAESNKGRVYWRCYFNAVTCF